MINTYILNLRHFINKTRVGFWLKILIFKFLIYFFTVIYFYFFQFIMCSCYVF